MVNATGSASRRVRPRTGSFRSREGPIVSMSLEPASAIPLYHQVYVGIRQRITDGVLPGGSALPSSRSLARDLCLSRSTIMLAYAQLQLEGYVQSRRGAATRVAITHPKRLVGPLVPASGRVHGGRPSRRAQEMMALPRTLANIFGQPPRAFRAGSPAVDVFPVETWGRLLARRWRRVPASSLAYQEPMGFAPLREAVCGYLRAARGVRCTPQQIIIVSGAQQGFDLAARALVDPGDKAWVEEPGYSGTRAVLTAAGATIVPVPVDEHGLVVETGKVLAPQARMAFVCPSRHVPLGVTLSLSRRLALLEWAHEARSWIIEDDYDSEFRYVGRPLASLQGLDESNCVVYVGTFSKITFPSLRLGYVVVPESLIDAFAAVRSGLDVCAPVLAQAAMADFIVEGHLERHIRRLRSLYQQRQALLVEVARNELGGLLDVPPSEAGMTLVGWLQSGIQAAEAFQAAKAHDVHVTAISGFAALPARPALLLGYAGVRDWEIVEGVGRLRKALEPLARRSFRDAAGR